MPTDEGHRPGIYGFRHVAMGALVIAVAAIALTERTARHPNKWIVYGAWLAAAIVVALWLWFTPSVRRYRLRWPIYPVPKPSAEEAHFVALSMRVREDLVRPYRSHLKPAVEKMHELAESFHGRLKERSEPYHSVGQLADMAVLEESQRSLAGLDTVLEGLLDLSNLGETLKRQVLEIQAKHRAPDEIQRAFARCYVDYRLLCVWEKRAARLLDHDLMSDPKWKSWKILDAELATVLRHETSHDHLSELRQSIHHIGWEFSDGS